MRGTDFIEKLDLVDQRYVQAANAFPKKRSAWPWCLAAGFVLCTVVLGAVLWRPVTGVTQTKDGVYIPPLQVSLSANTPEDMLGFFIYGGRIYLQYEWLDNPNMAGTHLGTVTGQIDEWTPKDGYVELAGSVSGELYTVEGYDPTFLLCLRHPNGVAATYICNTDITLKEGSELYEQRLHLAENFHTVMYESRASWNLSKGEIQSLSDREAVTAWILSLDEAVFVPWNTVVKKEGHTQHSIYDTELYHVYFKMNNGTTVHLRLYENGYVRFEGLLSVCVQVPPDAFRAFLENLIQ